jgi:hypothetical protein
MPELIFKKFGVYIMLSESVSMADFKNPSISKTNITDSQISEAKPLLE